MKFRNVFVLFLIFFSPIAQASDDGKAIVDRMITKMRGHINVSVYEMTVTRPKWERSITFRGWDDRKNKRMFIRVLEPSQEKGTAFLRINYNLWNYLPSVEKTMKIPPSLMLQPWMGSDFTNDDLVKESSYVDDYDHKVLGRETDGADVVVKIELIPKENAPVVWGKIIFWVREKDDLPTKQDFIDEKGNVIKELVFSDFKVMDGTVLPTVWEMKPVQRLGQKTTLKLKEIDFDPVPAISESIFSEDHLKP